MWVLHSVLHELHQLPMEYWLRSRVLFLTFKPLNGLGLIYLQDHLSWHVPRRALCSGSKNLLEVHGPKDIQLFSTNPGTFSARVPTWWKSLPDNLNAMLDLLPFHRTIKTEIFLQALSTLCFLISPAILEGQASSEAACINLCNFLSMKYKVLIHFLSALITLWYLLSNTLSLDSQGEQHKIKRFTK